MTPHAPLPVETRHAGQNAPVVVSLADWTRHRATAAAVEAGHPCVHVPHHELLVIGTGTVAHAVELRVDVPAQPQPDGTTRLPRTAIVTWCGRAAGTHEVRARVTGERPCRRCTTRLLRDRHG